MSTLHDKFFKKNVESSDLPFCFLRLYNVLPAQPGPADFYAGFYAAWGAEQEELVPLRRLAAEHRAMRDEHAAALELLGEKEEELEAIRAGSTAVGDG